MPIVSVDVPDELDIKVNVMKATKNVRSKEKMIVDILDEYFRNVESMKLLINSNNELRLKVAEQNNMLEKYQIDM